MPYLSALEVCSRRGAIYSYSTLFIIEMIEETFKKKQATNPQIHIYLYLYLSSLYLEMPADIVYSIEV